MIEKKILEAVCSVTDVTEEEVIGKSGSNGSKMARLMFYYLCHQYGLSNIYIASIVNKSDSLISKNINLFKKLLSSSGFYKRIIDEIRQKIDGESKEIKGEWFEHDGRKCFYADGKFYSILDVSSKYFGNYYLGFENDDIVTHCANEKEIMRRLSAISGMTIRKNISTINNGNGKYKDVKIDDINELLGVNVKSRSRDIDVVRARQGAWLCFYINGWSYNDIAKLFGFSRNTVEQGIDSFEDYLAKRDKDTVDIWNKLKVYEL